VAPKPLDHDAETTKLPHVDFADPDFLWRYSLAVPEAGDTRLRPWLVLLSGTVDQLDVKQGVATVRSPILFADHDWSAPWTWAHVQTAVGQQHCRLLSPRKKQLPPMSACVAAVVPAFDDAGQEWTQQANPPTSLRALYSWIFWTAEAGDFETLAAALRVREGGNLGRATVSYALTDQPQPVKLTVFGAIKPLKALPMGQEAPPQLDAVKADVGPRVAVQADDPDGRPVIGLPLYGRPWIDNPRSVAWGEQLFADPRFRGTAGVGLRMGIESQEKLLAAAIAQAGALMVARRRVGNLVLGLCANQALWRRRQPDDSRARLWVLAPAMARLAAVNNGAPAGTVLSAATSTDSPLPAALFSTAARRVLRRRGSVTRFVQTAAGKGIVKRSDLLDTANQCRNPFASEPNGLPDSQALASDLGLPTLADLYGTKPFPQKLLEFLQQFVGRPLNPAGVAAKVCDFLRELLGTPPVDPATLPNELQAAWTPQSGRPATEEVLLAPLGRFFEVRNRDVPEGTRGVVRPDPVPQPDPCRPRNLDNLGSLLEQALDPSQVVGRVADTIGGINIRATLAPPELPIVLQYPTWMLLKENAKEWLLPGVETLQRDSVTALSSNPEFIDAYLLGLNTQFKNELHWRKLADAPSEAPFTLFWGTIRGAELLARRTPDIRRFTEWISTPLGDSQHQYVEPDDPAGKRDLVIVFRTTLFRRYPGTQIYLRKIPANAAQVPASLEAAPNFNPASPLADHGPVFQGSIAEDIVFFIFNLAPEDLQQYWVMLEEPPVDLRFRVPFSADNPDTLSKPADKTTSATFAEKALDRPTRVAISWQSLGGA
jgi:hypothetical protein